MACKARRSMPELQPCSVANSYWCCRYRKPKHTHPSPASCDGSARLRVTLMWQSTSALLQCCQLQTLHPLRRLLTPLQQMGITRVVPAEGFQALSQQLLLQVLQQPFPQLLRKLLGRTRPEARQPRAGRRRRMMLLRGRRRRVAIRKSLLRTPRLLKDKVDRTDRN